MLPLRHLSHGLALKDSPEFAGAVLGKMVRKRLFGPLWGWGLGSMFSWGGSDCRNRHPRVGPLGIRVLATVAPPLAPLNSVENRDRVPALFVSRRYRRISP